MALPARNLPATGLLSREVGLRGSELFSSSILRRYLYLASRLQAGRRHEECRHPKSRMYSANSESSKCGAGRNRKRRRFRP